MSQVLYGLYDQRPSLNGQPFYFGIGIAKRSQKHFDLARYSGHWNKKVQEVFDAHKLAGVQPEARILCVGPNKDYLGDLERRVIKAYGRKDLDPDGILCNIAAGGQGPDSALMSLPEYREKSSKAQKRSYAMHPERRLAAAKGGKNASTPENNAARRKATIEHNLRTWADPEKSEARKRALRGKKKTASDAALEARRLNAQKGRTPEANAKKSAASKIMWADPAFKQRMSVTKRLQWQDPEKRAAMLAGRSDGIAKSWQDPVVRAKRIAAIRETIASRIVSRKDTKKVSQVLERKA